jgi:hypothetical protein
MKLYAGRIQAIAREIVEALAADGDIEVQPEQIEEVSLDIESVLKEYLRVDREVTDRARDVIATRNLPYNQLNKIKQQIADQRGFGLGEDSIDYLAKQAIEMLFHSHHVEEVFGEDHDLRRKMKPILKKHMAVDTELDQEVRGRIKNLQEGTSTWDIEYKKVMDELKRNRKLT